MADKYPCFLCQCKIGGTCIPQDQSKQNCELINQFTRCKKENCKLFHPMGMHLDASGVPIEVCIFGKTKCQPQKSPNCSNSDCRAGRSDWAEKKCKICRCKKLHIDQNTDLIELFRVFSQKHNLIKHKENEDYCWM